VAVFFPSYEFMGHVEPLLTSSVKGRGILVEMREQGKGERDALLLRLREGRNLLLATVSGSFAEGVDMKDNLLAAVLVVGLPLAPPSVESEAMARRLEARVGSRRAELYVHVYPAVTKVLQAAGRAIRSERDRAAVLLLDDRYFLPMIRQAFPADFRYSSDPNPFPRLLEFYPQGQTTGGDSAG
jgi:DNA excision repair protein ERCC-2